MDSDEKRASGHGVSPMPAIQPRHITRRWVGHKRQWACRIQLILKRRFIRGFSGMKQALALLHDTAIEAESLRGA
jgi:hypothetical protein